MGIIKGRNGKEPIEAESIKSWQEYTELYKKDLNDPDNHDSVITYPETDILECGPEALLPIKLVEVMEFQQSYLKSYKMVLLKCCTQSVSKFRKPAVATGLEKVYPHPNFQERAVLKNVQTTRQLHSSPMLVSICSKSFKLYFSIM